MNWCYFVRKNTILICTLIRMHKITDGGFGTKTLSKASTHFLQQRATYNCNPYNRVYCATSCNHEFCSTLFSSNVLSSTLACNKSRTMGGYNFTPTNDQYIPVDTGFSSIIVDTTKLCWKCQIMGNAWHVGWQCYCKHNVLIWTLTSLFKEFNTILHNAYICLLATLTIRGNWRNGGKGCAK